MQHRKDAAFIISHDENYSGTTKRGKKVNFWSVCKHEKEGFFEPLKPIFEHLYRPWDGLHMCCKGCWDLVGLEGACDTKKKQSHPTNPGEQ